jgi:hypothetical protein
VTKVTKVTKISDLTNEATKLTEVNEAEGAVRLLPREARRSGRVSAPSLIFVNFVAPFLKSGASVPSAPSAHQ